MVARDWDWSDIVNPQLVERALAHHEQRVQRRMLRAGNDPALPRERHDGRSVVT